MNTYITHSGIGTEANKVSVEGLIQLIKKTKSVRIKITDSLKEKGKKLDDANITLDDIEAPAEIIAECLNELSSCNSFMSIEDDNGDNYVLFGDKAPWEYTLKEKLLSKRDVEAYFKLAADVIIEMQVETLYIANYLE